MLTGAPDNGPRRDDARDNEQQTDSDTLRLSSLKAGKNTYTGNIQHLVYDYDRNSNITSILDKQNSNQYQCFTYDWLNRLESAYTDDDCAGSVVATGDGNYDDDFNYDTLGNVKPVGDGYVYGAGAAGPHAVTSANGWTFTYDSNGNQATRVHPGGTRTDTLTFDVNNRLTKYEVDSGGLAADTSFVYDADGSRVAVITDSGDVTHYIAGIHTHDIAAGTEENSYTFSGVTVGLNDDGVRHHVFTDHLATVTGTLAYGLAVANVERLRYSPYGDKRGSTGVVAGDRTYTGQVDDMTVTGLMFYNARYYDPVARNFVSPDTIIPDPASTLGWNRYSYVNNNPINHNDPSGHCTTSNGTLIDGTDDAPCTPAGFNQALASGRRLGFSDDLIVFAWNVVTGLEPFPNDGCGVGEMNFGSCSYPPANLGAGSTKMNSVEEARCRSSLWDCSIWLNDSFIALSNQNYGDGQPGGKNAIRHAIWSALLHLDFGAEEAYFWLFAHETLSPTGADDKARYDSDADWANNFYGQQIAEAVDSLDLDLTDETNFVLLAGRIALDQGKLCLADSARFLNPSRRGH